MFDVNQYMQLIDLVDQATNVHQKGRRFEDLAAYLFSSLDGVEVVERDINMDSEEIDLVLWNARIESVLIPWESVIFVECKNWSERVGAPVVDNFLMKLRRRYLKTGIFIAANGVTGTFFNSDDRGAVGNLKMVLQEGIRVIIVTMDDLRNISNIDDLRILIKKKYCSIFVHKFS